MEEAVIADRVIVMNEGLVAFEGTPAEVFRRGTELRKINLDVPPMVELRDDLAAHDALRADAEIFITAWDEWPGEKHPGHPAFFTVHAGHRK